MRPNQQYSKSPLRNQTQHSRIETPQQDKQGQNPRRSTTSNPDHEKVRIAIRIRPTLANESQEQFIRQVDDQTLKIMRPGNSLHMKFSSILPSLSNQEDVYKLTEEQVLSFLAGINQTIFAYGQTGAGKTYSILGDHSENPASLSNEQIGTYLCGAERGILPRSLETILQVLSLKNKEDYRLYISFYEVYNEKIFDLFNGRESRDGLEIRESKNGEVSMPNLITVEIQTIQQAMDILMVGLRNRATGSTCANAKSSRSHSIFQILLQQKVTNSNSANQQGVVESQLRIVDLAGSEKFKIPHDQSVEEREIRIAELTCINGSLSTLGHCISALIDRNRTHIPFRNSKLTRVLSDSLSGTGKITFIVCISPSFSSASETFSTLQFANRAKRAVLDGRNIRQQDKSSASKKMIDYEEYDELAKAYAREKFLREEMEKRLRTSSQHYDLEVENMLLKRENEELRAVVHSLRNGSSSSLSSDKTQSQSTTTLNRNSIIGENSNINYHNINGNDATNQERNSSSDKRVRFNGGNHTAQDISSEDQIANELLGLDENSLMDNLSIFKGISQIATKQQQQQQPSKHQNQQSNQFNSRTSQGSDIASFRINQFWKAGEDEGVIDDIAQNINFGKLDENKVLQRIKHKEIEQKLERFFAYNSSESDCAVINANSNQQNKHAKGQNNSMKLQDASYQIKNNNNANDLSNQNKKQHKNYAQSDNSEAVSQKFESIRNALAMVDEDPTAGENGNIQTQQQQQQLGVISSVASLRKQIDNNQIANRQESKKSNTNSRMAMKNEEAVYSRQSGSPENELNSLNFDTNQTSSTNKNFDSIIQRVQDKSQNITNIVHDLKQEMSKAISQLHMLQQADQEIHMSSPQNRGEQIYNNCNNTNDVSFPDGSVLSEKRNNIASEQYQNQGQIQLGFNSRGFSQQDKMQSQTAARALQKEKLKDEDNYIEVR